MKMYWLPLNFIADCENMRLKSKLRADFSLPFSTASNNAVFPFSSVAFKLAPNISNRRKSSSFPESLEICFKTNKVLLN